MRSNLNNGPGAGFTIFAILATILNLALIGVGIWAVIELVQWVTAK